MKCKVSRNESAPILSECESDANERIYVANDRPRARAYRHRHIRVPARAGGSAFIKNHVPWRGIERVSSSREEIGRGMSQLSMARTVVGTLAPTRCGCDAAAARAEFLIQRLPRRGGPAHVDAALHDADVETLHARNMKRLLCIRVGVELRRSVVMLRRWGLTQHAPDVDELAQPTCKVHVFTRPRHERPCVSRHTHRWAALCRMGG